MRKFLAVLGLFWSLGVTAQQIPTPDTFLGYPLGSKFTYHHRVLDYVNQVAALRPNETRVISYGQTYERRPLQVIVVGSAQHIQNLETIRQNNLKGIGLLSGQPSGSIPAIAWLSYNVHGNEAVSTEAVMKVLYELLNPQNELSKKILEKTVVILDPCINPDGHERYTQWYNRIMGVEPDLSPASVEHHEPWPGGRFNHYLFDLNRDWAWQTQVESQQRLKLYQQWMPHLHADFHEMGPNSTYYFPPSARPYHADLTQYQRDFQNLLGEYNKKEFDDKGWLYFTKENYDLLYPSYGDTYPSYNGAIGMTFEQGGSGNAGVRFLQSDGDTLTLTDRINHHAATSFGTLQAVSDKATATVEAFKNHFNEPAAKGFGAHKAFVMKTKGREAQASQLVKMLEGMQIKTELAAGGGSRSGFNFITKKSESFSVDEGDLVVSTQQPKGRLVKILFEPETALEDSNTYDITSWALPYAFGLPAYAVGEGVRTKSGAVAAINNPLPARMPFAYAIKNHSFEAQRLVAQLLKNNFTVRIHETPFSIGNENFGSGTVLITARGNESAGALPMLIKLANAYQIQLYPLATGLASRGTDVGSEEVYALTKPKVALLTGEGLNALAVGEVWHYFERQLEYPVTMVDQSYFSKINLWDFNVLVLPAGKYDKILKEEELKRWIRDGGKVIAMESALNFFEGKEGFGLKAIAQDKKEPKPNLLAYHERMRDALSDQIPGAIFQVKMDASHPLGFGFENGYQALIRDTDRFNYLADGWNVGRLMPNAHLAGFVGARLKPLLKDNLIAGVQDMGRGQLIYLNTSPLFRGFWYSGKQLFGNALLYVK